MANYCRAGIKSLRGTIGLLDYRNMAIGLYFFSTIELLEYRISYRRIQETIWPSDIWSRPQSIWLSDIGLRKNYRLPTSAIRLSAFGCRTVIFFCYCTFGILNIELTNSRNYRTTGYRIKASIYWTIDIGLRKTIVCPALPFSNFWANGLWKGQVQSELGPSGIGLTRRNTFILRQIFENEPWTVFFASRS